MNNTIPKIAAGHPRLFINSTLLPIVKERMGHSSYQVAVDKIQISINTEHSGVLSSEYDKDNGNYSDDIRQIIEANAFAYLMSGEGKYAAIAISMMKNFIASLQLTKDEDVGARHSGQIMASCALVYDWCYDSLTHEDQQYFIQALIAFAGKQGVGYPPTELGAVTSHGSEAQIIRDMLSAGIAIYDEYPEMYQLAAGRFFKEYIPARNFAAPSHAHHQGTGYGPFRSIWDMFALWMFDRMGHKDILSPEYIGIAYYMLYMQRPDGQFMRDGDTVIYKDINKKPGAISRILMHMASYYRDPILHQSFLRLLDGVGWTGCGWSANFIEPVEYLLFYDHTVDQKALDTLPLCKYFPYPVGMTVARTGWTMGEQSNDVTAMFKVGIYNFNNHQHLDAGQFQIYHKGALAIDSGIYNGYGSPHDKNYNKRTIAHNCMLIYNPDEKMYIYDNVEENDGGQQYPNQAFEPFLVTDLFPAHQVCSVDARATKGFTDGSYFTYLKGDLTNAYQEKVKDYKRSFVFIHTGKTEVPALVVVYDTVTSASKDYKKTYLLHSINEPACDGDTVVIENGGRLTGTTLLPKADNISIEKIGGEGMEFFVAGKNFPMQPKKLDVGFEEGGAWRVEISPKTPAETDAFLNVMQITDGGVKPEKCPILIESATHTGGVVGQWAVLFSKSGLVSRDEITLMLEGNGYTTCIVTDLKSGEWAIEQYGEFYQMIAVEEGKGVLWFLAPAGEYRLYMNY